MLGGGGSMILLECAWRYDGAGWVCRDISRASVRFMRCKMGLGRFIKWYTWWEMEYLVRLQRRHPVKQSRGDWMVASAIVYYKRGDLQVQICTVVYNRQSKGCMMMKHDRTVPRNHGCISVGRV